MCASKALAYTFSFTNHTGRTLYIGIKLAFLGAKTHRKLVDPHRRIYFDIDDFGWIQAGGCLDHIFCLKDPTLDHVLEPNAAPIREYPITWVKPENYNDIIELSESVGKITETIAKIAIHAGAAAATGGASVGVSAGVESSISGLSAASTALKAVKSDVPAGSTEPAGQIGAETTAGSLGIDFGLSKLIGGVAKAIYTSVCKTRHFDVIEDEKGQIHFIALM
jgi:hypothetical protein